MSDERPESSAPRNMLPPELAQELTKWLEAWRERWISHRDALHPRDRYVYCGLGAFTYFFALQFLPHTGYRPGDQSLLILIVSLDFASALFIYVAVPTLLFTVIVGHSERPRGRVGLYLDGFLLPLAVTYLLNFIRPEIVR